MASGKEPFIEFNEKRPESYWDEFLVDVIFQVLPLALVILSIGSFVLKHNIYYLWLGMILSGLAYLMQTIFSYPYSDSAPMTVKSLLSKVKVSAIRPVPCSIKGKIIGRGIPGYIFSEDFVLQDDTGIIFLDYRQPLGIIDFLFGLLRAAKYINQEAEIIGWYRRSPVPYIEIRKLIIDGKESVCYSYYFKLFISVALTVAGCIMFFSLPAI